jgi:hypothetical protein
MSGPWVARCVYEMAVEYGAPPRRACRHCWQPLAASWLSRIAWTGRCASCRGLLGPRVWLVVLAGAVFRWILSAQVRRLGIEVVGFALSYTLYLFAVFLPTQSLARLVLPLTPLLADSRLSASARARRWSLGGSIAVQAVAVYLLWALGNP